MNEQIDGWMDGRRDEWIDRWVDEGLTSSSVP